MPSPFGTAASSSPAPGSSRQHRVHHPRWGSSRTPARRLRHHPGSLYVWAPTGSTTSSALLVALPRANPQGPGVSAAEKTHLGSPPWGTALLGPPGHSQALPPSGGSGAVRRRSCLPREAVSSYPRHSLREILSGPPARLRPSSHALRWLMASREAPAPGEGTGCWSLPQTRAGSVPPLTSGPERGSSRLQDRPPVPHLRSGTGLPGDGTLFHRIYVGPSGARGLSVHHLWVVGHTPYVQQISKDIKLLSPEPPFEIFM
ncbi:hypothetical protein NDU88_002084 [Pleurodeles waltl]|uniref:Uncharacterized protein n=1 Tax=Pleurodeles waltl TaxID=8319 RepID=A0AAV7M1D7_PLEWA|nr:hypothetical protein NDU88_002084 [Pleurodeles waltl]